MNPSSFVKRSLFCLLAFLCCGVGNSWATFTLVQKASNTTCSFNSNSCNVTVSSTGSGHAIGVLTIIMGSTVAEAVTSISGGGTYTDCAACDFSSLDSGLGSYLTVAGNYTLNSSSGVTTITVNITQNPSNSNWGVFIFEYSSTGTITFDTGNHVNDFTGTSSSTWNGPALTLSGSNDAIMQTIGLGFGTAATAIDHSYADTTFSGNGSGADLLNTASGSAPQWTFASSNHEMVGAAMAFQDSGGGSTPKSVIVGGGIQ